MRVFVMSLSTTEHGSRADLDVKGGGLKQHVARLILKWPMSHSEQEVWLERVILVFVYTDGSFAPASKNTFLPSILKLNQCGRAVFRDACCRHSY